MLNYGTENLVAPAGPSPRGAGRFACSQQSVLRAIDRFISAVDNMDATVLVPSRLRDMAVQNRRKPHPLPPGVHQHQDLHSFYNMLKDVKNELLWGPSSVNVSLFDSLSSMSSPRVVRGGMTTPGMTTGMTTPRQASDDGLGSSVGCSDTDSDFESIVADRDSIIMEQTSHLATAFRHHLHGLHAILHQLADSADYLSSRYQEEIESP